VVSTGTGKDNPPSASNFSPCFTGLKIKGIEILALIAGATSP